jgi:peptidoglycan lytic transglycosylase
MLLGMVFHQQRELERSLRLLQQALGAGDALPEREAREARFVQANVQLSQQRYGSAAVIFGSLAQRAGSLRERARALYQQGRSYELLRRPELAVASFQLSYQADPSSDSAAPALLSALRLAWRGGDEASAATLFYVLVSRPEWRESALRAGLFMAASDIVRGRGDRAGAWLDRLLPSTADDHLELAYWRGRLAELNKDPRAAVDAYLDVLRGDLYHPLARVALARLAADPLAPAAREEGLRLAGSRRPQDLYGAWLLLGDRDATGQAARSRLLQLLSVDRATRPFVRLAEAPIGSWPLWKNPLPRPEDKLLALGMWHEGAPAVRDQFPVTDPSLWLTGSLFLCRGGEYARSIQQAEVLLRRMPGTVPPALLPRVLQVVLYPNPYRQILIGQGRLRGVNPDLLAALIREESGFDKDALSPRAARGLTQLTVPAAQRIAAQIDLRFEPGDLYRPEVSAALGAAGLSLLLHHLDGLDYMAVAAYEAGLPEALLWRTYCFGPGHFDEYYTKIGLPEARDFVRRVLTSREHYDELY